MTLKAIAFDTPANRRADPVPRFALRLMQNESNALARTARAHQPDSTLGATHADIARMTGAELVACASAFFAAAEAITGNDFDLVEIEVACARIHEHQTLVTNLMEEFNRRLAHAISLIEARQRRDV